MPSAGRDKVRLCSPRDFKIIACQHAAMRSVEVLTCASCSSKPRLVCGVNKPAADCLDQPMYTRSRESATREKDWKASARKYSRSNHLPTDNHSNSVPLFLVRVVNARSSRFTSRGEFGRIDGKVDSHRGGAVRKLSMFLDIGRGGQYESLHESLLFGKFLLSSRM